MHIVYAIREFEYNTTHGGVISYVTNISEIFARHGHKISIVAISDKHRGSHFWKKNITIEYINLRDTFLGRQLLTYKESHTQYSCLIRIIEKVVRSYEINRRIKKLHKTDKIDLIQYASPTAIGLFRIRAIPTIVRISQDPTLWRETEDPNYNMKSSMNRVSFEDKLELAAIKRADVVFAPSKLVAEIIEKRLGLNVSVIESPFNHNKNSFQYKNQKSILHDKNYFLYFGILSNRKAMLTIADILENVLRDYPNMYFVFAGENRELELKDGRRIRAVKYLKEKAGKQKDRVIHFNGLKRESLYPIIERADICILPSRIDNLANSFIEAMALGKIVISTYGSSAEQLITQGVNGILVKQESPRSLKNAIDFVMKMDKIKRNRIGIRAKESLQRLEPEMVYQKHLKFYLDLLKKRERPSL
ncbi:glycosyltransferase family 4 protein [Anaerosacchariphilus polymeriproducens]|nr:glycosyltransferase family 4 protein [Anaerosacchariphilus polymeriproducens]